MDEIQKVLVKMGRKDLAQEYYKKIAIKESRETLLKQLKKLEEKKQKQDFMDIPLQTEIAKIVRKLDHYYKGWQKYASKEIQND